MLCERTSAKRSFDSRYEDAIKRDILTPTLTITTDRADLDELQGYQVSVRDCQTH